MTEYLWKVLFNLRYPPKRVKVKRELKDMYIMADKQLHEAVKAKPNNEKSIAAISSYCCYFYTEEAANEFYQSRQKQNESRKGSNVSAVEKENRILEIALHIAVGVLDAEYRAFGVNKENKTEERIKKFLEMAKKQYEQEKEQ